MDDKGQWEVVNLVTIFCDDSCYTPHALPFEAKDL